MSLIGKHPGNLHAGKCKQSKPYDTQSPRVANIESSKISDTSQIKTAY